MSVSYGNSNVINNDATSKTKPKIIFVGGSDNVGGAGIIADIKTSEYFNCYGMVVFTCITVQNFKVIKALKVLSVKLVIGQLKALISANLAIRYIKISLVTGATMIKQVSKFLTKQPQLRLIYDTVFVKNNRDFFVSDDNINLLILTIIPQAYLATSNIQEFKHLLYKARINFTNGMLSKIEQIKILITKLCNNFLNIKRYFVRGLEICKNNKIIFINILFCKGKFDVYPFKYVQTTNDHGSGCAISTAITCNLAQGLKLEDACLHATSYATRCIELARNNIRDDYSINFSQM